MVVGDVGAGRLRARSFAKHVEQGGDPNVTPNLENLHRAPGSGAQPQPPSAVQEVRPAWQDAILAEKKESDQPVQKS
jgi:hypothetical protein